MLLKYIIIFVIWNYMRGVLNINTWKVNMWKVIPYS